MTMLYEGIGKQIPVKTHGILFNGKDLVPGWGNQGIRLQSIS